MKERYLVTGGAGFIGSNIVEALLREKHRVRVLDNLSTGKRENLAFAEDLCKEADQLELLEGDIRDYDTCRAAVRGVDYVIHQAALPSVPRSVEDPVTSNAVNVTGTLNLLWTAKEAGAKRFVYASSSSVYGNAPTLPKHEAMKPGPLSPYAVGKLTGEYYCMNFFSLYGFETVALRYFNVFGPRQDPESQYAAVIPKFITALDEGRSPTIYGDGEQSRDFTFVKNVVEVNLLAARATGLTQRIFNVACGERVTLNELLEQLQKLCGTEIEPVFEASRAGDVKHSLADIELAKEELGFTPRFSLEEGLAETVKWYLKPSEESP